MREMTKTRSFGHRDMLRVEANTVYRTRPQENSAALYSMGYTVHQFLSIVSRGLIVQTRSLLRSILSAENITSSE